MKNIKTQWYILAYNISTAYAYASLTTDSNFYLDCTELVSTTRNLKVISLLISDFSECMCPVHFDDSFNLNISQQVFQVDGHVGLRSCQPTLAIPPNYSASFSNYCNVCTHSPTTSISNIDIDARVGLRFHQPTLAIPPNNCSVRTHLHIYIYIYIFFTSNFSS